MLRQDSPNASVSAQFSIGTSSEMPRTKSSLGSFLQYTTEPWTQNPGGDESSTISAGSQNSCVTIFMPDLLTFSTGTTSKTPGLFRLVNPRYELSQSGAQTLAMLREALTSRPAMD